MRLYLLGLSTSEKNKTIPLPPSHHQTSSNITSGLLYTLVPDSHKTVTGQNNINSVPFTDETEVPQRSDSKGNHTASKGRAGTHIQDFLDLISDRAAPPSLDQGLPELHIKSLTPERRQSSQIPSLSMGCPQESKVRSKELVWEGWRKEPRAGRAAAEDSGRLPCLLTVWLVGPGQRGLPAFPEPRGGPSPSG